MERLRCDRHVLHRTVTIAATQHREVQVAQVAEMAGIGGRGGGVVRTVATGGMCEAVLRGLHAYNWMKNMKVDEITKLQAKFCNQKIVRDFGCSKYMPR